MLGLDNDEIDLVEKIEAYLASRDLQESGLVKHRIECLNALGASISNYPSIRETQRLRGVERDEEMLIEALCSFASSSYLLHIPVKVVATRSYLVAKYQTFSLLHKLAGDREEFHNALRKVILTVIHTLMTEEVYFTCLIDPDFSHEIKLTLADDLISL